jgi:hypothetical protein
MNTKEFYTWLETCPTHKWEVNDEFGDIGAGYITVSFSTQEEDLTESDFIATIFDEYGAGVWSRDADLRTAVKDAAKRFRMDFAGIYRLPPDFTFRVFIYDVRNHERVYVGATEVRCADTKQHIPVLKVIEWTDEADALEEWMDKHLPQPELLPHVENEETD